MGPAATLPLSLPKASCGRTLSRNAPRAAVQLHVFQQGTAVISGRIYDFLIEVQLPSSGRESSLEWEGGGGVDSALSLPLSLPSLCFDRNPKNDTHTWQGKYLY
jgi:hypothetical protein